MGLTFRCVKHKSLLRAAIICSMVAHRLICRRLGLSKRITITIEDDLAARIERERAAEDRPETQMVVRLVKEALDAREKRNG